MPKFLVHCDTGFCGVNEDVVVVADDEQTAESTACMWWDEQVEPSVNVIKELKETDDDYDDYQEIE